MSTLPTPRFVPRPSHLDDELVESGYDANGSPTHERAQDQRLAERIAADRVAAAMHAGATPAERGAAMQQAAAARQRAVDEAHPRNRLQPDRGYLAQPVPTHGAYVAERSRRARFWFIAAGAVLGGLVGFVVAMVQS